MPYFQIGLILKTCSEHHQNNLLSKASSTLSPWWWGWPCLSSDGEWAGNNLCATGGWRPCWLCWWLWGGFERRGEGVAVGVPGDGVVLTRGDSVDNCNKFKILYFRLTANIHCQLCIVCQHFKIPISTKTDRDKLSFGFWSHVTWLNTKYKANAKTFLTSDCTFSQWQASWLNLRHSAGSCLLPITTSHKLVPPTNKVSILR